MFNPFGMGQAAMGAFPGASPMQPGVPQMGSVGMGAPMGGVPQAAGAPQPSMGGGMMDPLLQALMQRLGQSPQMPATGMWSPKPQMKGQGGPPMGGPPMGGSPQPPAVGNPFGAPPGMAQRQPQQQAPPIAPTMSAKPAAAAPSNPFAFMQKPPFPGNLG